MSSSRTRQLLFLELNEVNFEYIRRYVARGLLPTFASLLNSQGYARTESEREYDKLEPWIQWVTAHTGKTFAEHGVFRLGDIVERDIPQIWEQLEQRGLRVGAISPMNAKNRLRNAAFFVPDPWTRTEVNAGTTLKNLYEAIAQAVSDNAASRVTWQSLLRLLRGFITYGAAVNFPQYTKLAAGSRGRPWRKAMFLDLLLADVFVHEVRATRPDFATLFVNAGAHIQHHYLFCSQVYDGPSRNPDWYVQPGVDPVLEVYELYDRIVARVLAEFPQSRIMLGTGLHQNPHGSVTFYWRLKDHAQFLRTLEIPFESVQGLMSRDFVVCCGSPERARVTEQMLSAVIAADGTRLFDVDNRGSDLFVMLTYPHDIETTATFQLGERTFGNLRDQVVFVALKNGEHDGIGYLLDSGRRFDPEAEPISLADVPKLVESAVLG